MPTRIVIIGGGFAGIQTLFSLRRHMRGVPYTATLISDKEFFSFTPFLAEVVGGVLPPLEAMTSFQYIIRKDKESYIHGKVTNINLENKVAYIGEREYPYDYLVIAIGSTSNFLHVTGAQENTLVVKDVADADILKSEVNNIFEKASNIQDINERKDLLTFAIIGGGATGIEIAADIKEHIDTLLSEKYRLISPQQTKVMLITSGTEIAKEFDENIRQKTAGFLTKENIELKFNARVKEVQQEKIILTDNTIIPASLIVWAAGVKPNEMSVTPENVIHHQYQKFIINDKLQLLDFPDVYAIGDVSMYQEDRKQLPMLAQVAVSEGSYVGKSISYQIRKIIMHPFSFSLKGEMISIGREEGVANIFGIDVTGKLAWLVWKVFYFFKFIDNRKKPIILKYWLKEFLKTEKPYTTNS